MFTSSPMSTRGGRFAGLLMLTALLNATASAQQSLSPTGLDQARAASALYADPPALTGEDIQSAEWRIVAPTRAARSGPSSSGTARELLTDTYRDDEQFAAMLQRGQARPRTRVIWQAPLAAVIEPGSTAHTNELEVAFGLRATVANETIKPQVMLNFADGAGRALRSLVLDFDPITLERPGICIVRSRPIDLAAARLDFPTPADLQIELIVLDASGELPIAGPRVFALVDASPDNFSGSPLGLILRGCPSSNVMGLRVNEGAGNCVRAGDPITITLYRECMIFPTEGFQAFLYFDNEDLTFDPNHSYYLPEPYGQPDPNFNPIVVSGPGLDEINLRAWIDQPSQVPTTHDADLVVLSFVVNPVANGLTRIGYRQEPLSGFIDLSGNIYFTTLNTATDIFVDNTPPTLTCPPNLPLQCVVDVPPAATSLGEFLDPNCCGGAGSVFDVSTFWGCALTFEHVSDTTSGTGCPADPYIVERVYRVTDHAGNWSECTQTITVIDDTAPVFDPNFPPDVDVECTEPTDPNATGHPTGSDNCSTTTISYDDVFAPACGSTGTITRTWTIQDECGNETSRPQLITIVDTTPPTITTPPDPDTVECDGSGFPIQIGPWLASNGGAAAEDTCGAVSWTNDFDPGNIVADCGDTGYVDVVFTAHDECGNTTDTAAVRFTIVDATPPEVTTSPSDKTVECDGTGLENQIAAWLADHGNGVAADLCGGVTWSHDFDPVNFVPDCGMTGYVDVTFTATDDCENAADPKTARFTIEDTTPPTVDPQPAPQTVECDGTGVESQIANWLAANGGADASDACGGVTWSSDFDPANFVAACGMTGHVVVTFTATDECGIPVDSNTATFTIEDTTDPNLHTPPVADTVECDGTGIENQIADWLARNGDAAAADDCGDITWSNDFDPANFITVCGMTGYVDVIFTATDDCANTTPSAPARFTIEDTTNPSIDTCGDEFYCNDPDTCQRSVPLVVTGSDTCGDVTISYEIDQIPISSPHTFDLGITTVTAIVADDCGNSLTCEFEVEIVDCDEPVVACPGDVAKDAYPGECGDILLFTADASDNCTAVPDIIYRVESDPLGDPNDFDLVITSPQFFPVGTTRVLAEAADEAANFDTCIFTVTINDVEDPEFEDCPGSVVVDTDPNLCTATIGWNAPTATDNCELQEVGGTHDPGFAFPLGDTEVVYTATDVNNNTATCTFTVTVNDNQPPVLLDCPEDMIVPLDVGQNQAFVTWTAPTAADNCGASDPNAAYEPGDFFPVGTTTVTYTTVDGAGNTASCSFDVTVQELNELWVNIELGPPEAMAPLSTRCVTFQLWNCFTETWINVDRELDFVNGQASEVVLVPAGDYQCILARDKYHTLWQRDDYFSRVGDHYVANFTGDPQGIPTGNWLVCGDIYLDDRIDILDFAAMLTETEHAPYPDGNTLCNLNGWNGDIDGDGAITTADFTFIHVNYMETMDPNCCGSPLFRDAPPSPPRTSIRVEELGQLGLQRLRSADRNADGIIDQRDIAAFFMSQRAMRKEAPRQDIGLKAIKD